MTANELQRLAVRLSNSCWVRHWLCQGHVGQDAEMWIQVLDHARITSHLMGPKMVPNGEMQKLGFQWDVSGSLYKIARTNEDGTPYIRQI